MKALLADDESPIDFKYLENIALEDPETRDFIMYLQQVQPNIKFPKELEVNPYDTKDSKQNHDLEPHSPQSTVRATPGKTSKISPTLPKVSAMKRV